MVTVEVPPDAMTTEAMEKEGPLIYFSTVTV